MHTHTYLELGTNHLARTAPSGGEVNGDDALGNGAFEFFEGVELFDHSER